MAANPRIDDWQGRVAWVIGASSGIGRATAAALHARGAQVAVSARHAGALHGFVAGHAGSRALPLDVGDGEALREGLQRVLDWQGRIDLLLYCAGHYHPMRAASYRYSEVLRHLDVNFLGAARLLEPLLPVLLAQGHGHLSLVASVAGYRGLPQAMAYGPSKAALQHLAETLYLDLRPAGIGVSVVNPGFVATPLTAGNDFAMPALLTPDQAASAMLRGWAQGRFDIHFPRRFTSWMKLLQLLPHGLYTQVVHRATGH